LARANERKETKDPERTTPHWCTQPAGHRRGGDGAGKRVTASVLATAVRDSRVRRWMVVGEKEENALAATAVASSAALAAAMAAVAEAEAEEEGEECGREVVKQKSKRPRRCIRQMKRRIRQMDLGFRPKP